MIYSVYDQISFLVIHIIWIHIFSNTKTKAWMSEIWNHCPVNSSIKTIRVSMTFSLPFGCFGLNLWIYGSTIQCVNYMLLCVISNEKLYFYNQCFIYDSLLVSLLLFFFFLSRCLFDSLRQDLILTLCTTCTSIKCNYFILLSLFSRNPSVSS